MSAKKLLRFIIFFLFLSCTNAKTINDFNADDYQKILTRTDKYSAVAFKTDDIREIDFVTHNGKTLLTQNDYIVDWTGDEIVNIWNTKDQIHHTLLYKQNSYLPYRYTFSHKEYVGPDAEILGKRMFNKLIATGQFIIKESALRKGSDIIVNEQQQYFIIGSIMGTKDNPLGVEFSCYEK